MRSVHYYGQDPGAEIECQSRSKFAGSRCASTSSGEGATWVAKEYVSMGGNAKVMARLYRCKRGHEIEARWSVVEK